MVYWDQWFSARAILSSGVHGTMSGDISDGQDWQVSKEKHAMTGIQWVEAAMLLHILQCTGKLKTTVPRLRNPTLNAHCFNS